MIEHNIKHYYQPTNFTCSQSSLAMLLSFYGDNKEPLEIAAEVPVLMDSKGEEFGSINQQLATWCMGQGYKASIYTADFEVLDLEWQTLTVKALRSRMQELLNIRDVKSIGKNMTKMYMQSYIDFIDEGGQLEIVPNMSSHLLDKLLPNGPLLACVCYNVLYNSGRSRNHSLRKSEYDDVKGKLSNHSIVIYGKDDDGNYLIADPYKKPGRHAIESERLLISMTAAQMECDNLIFQLNKKQV